MTSTIQCVWGLDQFLEPLLFWAVDSGYVWIKTYEKPMKKIPQVGENDEWLPRGWSPHPAFFSEWMLGLFSDLTDPNPLRLPWRK